MQVVRRIIYTGHLFGREPKLQNTGIKLTKNKLTSILRLAEKAYYSKMLLEKRGNIKEIWAILNTVLCKQRQSVNYPTHLMPRDIHSTSKQNMAI